jgi:hypothetical protein
MFIVAAILFYHRQVKMFSIKYLTVFGTILLLTFLLLGFYRGATDPSTLLAPLLSANEFLVLLGNAMHIHSMKEAGFNFPLILYFNDFLGLLPPQEILPFEKIAASNWYLRYLGVEGTAFGYMWGVISQSIIGFDRFELVMPRGHFRCTIRIFTPLVFLQPTQLHCIIVLRFHLH